VATLTKTPQAEQSKKNAVKKRTAKIDSPQTQSAAPALVQLALADPNAVAPSVILALQRSHGNRAIHRLIANGKGSPSSKSESASSATPTHADSHPVVGAPRSKSAPSLSGNAVRRSALPTSSTADLAPRSQPASITRSSIQPKSIRPQAESQPAPSAVAEPPLELNQPVSGYVPPVAPPATPPPNGNQHHRVGSPYRHLDGVSNRKIQTKLTVGPARDKYEQEADAMADRVMRMTDPQAAPISETDSVSTVNRSGGDHGFEVDTQVEHQINNGAGSGNPLPANTRQKMESRFGVGFGSVRIHTGSESNKLNRQLNAQAFTHGSNIFFGEGKFNPGTTSGQHLLAHELTHVVQQGAASTLRTKPNRQLQRKVVKLIPGQRMNVLAPGVGTGLFTRDEAPTGSHGGGTGQGPALDELDLPPDEMNPEQIGERYAQLFKTEPQIVGDWARLYAWLTSERLPVRLQADKYFRKHTGVTLRQWVYSKDRSSEFAVRCASIAHNGEDKGKHVELALALIAKLTPPDQVVKVLKSMSLTARKKTVRLYETIYGGSQREGAFKRDVEAVLFGYWDDYLHQQTLALIERELTPADELYAATTGRRGTDSAEAYRVIKTAWDGGLSVFDQLVKDWDTYIKPYPGAKGRSLIDAMYDEFGLFEGEDLDRFKVILESYHKARINELLPSGAGSDTKDKQGGFDSEQNQSVAKVEAARGLIKAHSGITESTTSDEQVIEAAEMLRKAWTSRIERARKVNPEMAAKLEQEWEAERASLMARSQSYLGFGKIRIKGRNETRMKLALYGDSSAADQIYGFAKASRYDKIQSLVETAWASGNYPALVGDMGKEKKMPDGKSVLRPAFGASDILAGLDHGDPLWRRIMAVMDSRATDDAARGANRIVEEFRILGRSPTDDANPADGDLDGLVALLTMSALTPELRHASIERLMQYAHNVDTFEGAFGAEKAFLDSIRPRFENGIGHNYNLLVRALLPTKDAKELYERQKKQMAAQHTGTFSGFLNTVTKAKASVFGGGDREATARQQMETTGYIASANKSAPAMQIIGEQTEKDTRGEAALHYDEQFQMSLKEYRDELKSVADTIAGAVELGFELLITGLTGGQGIWAVVASVASLMANKATSELLLGSNYKLVSDQNIKDLLVAAASSTLDEFVDIRKRIADAVDFEKTQWFVRKVGEGKEAWAQKVGNAMQNLGAGVADGTINALTSVYLDSLLLGKTPTVDTFMKEAYKIASQSAGRALHAPLGTYKNNPGVLANDFLSFQDRQRINFIFKELVKLCEGTGKKLGELITSDTSKLTWVDILDKLGTPELKGFFTAAMKSQASARGQHRRAELRKKMVELIDQEDKSAKGRAAEYLTTNIESGEKTAKSFEYHQKTNRAHNEFVKSEQGAGRGQGLEFKKVHETQSAYMSDPKRQKDIYKRVLEELDEQIAQGDRPKSDKQDLEDRAKKALKEQSRKQTPPSSE
jgi:hypothetical protein